MRTVSPSLQLSPLFVLMSPGSDSNWLTVSGGSSEVAAHKRMAKSLICMELIKGPVLPFSRWVERKKKSYFFLRVCFSLSVCLPHTHTHIVFFFLWWSLLRLCVHVVSALSLSPLIDVNGRSGEGSARADLVITGAAHPN